MQKVLIITYYWPPSGGSGVQRWLKFSKYLPEYGWEPLIFTPENPQFDIKDESLLKDVRKETEVIKFPIWEPFNLFQKIKGKNNKDHAARQASGLDKKHRTWLDHITVWIRGNLLIPDSRVFWVRPAAKFLEQIIESNQIDTVITTGPPHSMHLIGLRLKRKFSIKWLADFRDPWSVWDVLDKLDTTRLARYFHKKLEKKVLKNADEVTTVSPTLAKKFENISGKKVVSITNGVDFEDFSHIEPVPVEKFRISHVGVFRELRNPKMLWKALAYLCRENKEFARDLEIDLTGTISPYIIEEINAYEELREVLVTRPHQNHDEVLKIYYSSAVLLLVLNVSDNGQWNMPAKLFEYLYSRRPVLVIGSETSDAATLIKDVKGGYCFPFQDLERIKEGVWAMYRDFKAGKTTTNAAIEKFSRKALTGKMAELLNKLQNNY